MASFLDIKTHILTFLHIFILNKSVALIKQTAILVVSCSERQRQVLKY